MAFGDGNAIGTNQSTKITRFVGFSDTVEDSFVIADQAFQGVTTDSTPDLYSGDTDTVDDIFRKHDGFSTTISSSFTSSGSLTGISHDDTDLYSGNTSGTDRNQQHTGFTATIQDSFAPPNFPYVNSKRKSF